MLIPENKTNTTNANETTAKTATKVVAKQKDTTQVKETKVQAPVAKVETQVADTKAPVAKAVEEMASDSVKTSVTKAEMAQIISGRLGVTQKVVLAVATAMEEVYLKIAKQVYEAEGKLQVYTYNPAPIATTVVYVDAKHDVVVIDPRTQTTKVSTITDRVRTACTSTSRQWNVNSKQLESKTSTVEEFVESEKQRIAREAKSKAEKEAKAEAKMRKAILKEIAEANGEVKADAKPKTIKKTPTKLMLNLG